MKQRLIEYLLVVLLLSPLLYINVRDSHDWGDDFACYIAQGRNITEGKPFYDTGFEFSEETKEYAPPFYSVGFPLLLAPVIKIWGINYKAFNYYLSLFLVAWGLLVYYFLRRHFSLLMSLCFTLIFFLNPFLFYFKTNIISDIPLSFFFTLGMVLILNKEKISYRKALILGVLIAFTASIKGLGYLLLVPVLLSLVRGCNDYLFKVQSKKETLAKLLSFATMISAMLGSTYLLNSIFFPTTGSNFDHNFSLYFKGDSYLLFFRNLEIYDNQLLSLFNNPIDIYSFSIQLTQSFILVFIVLGLLHSLFSFRHLSLVALFVAFALAIVLFPVSTQGFRYLLPIVPLIIFFAIRGALAMSLPRAIHRYAIIALFMIMIAMQYYPSIKTMKANQASLILPGPMSRDNIEAFDYIKSHLPTEALIICLKPRAISLFTGRRSRLISRHHSPVENRASLDHTASPTYVMAINDENAGVGPDMIDPSRDSLVFQNSATKLFKINARQ